jgi:amino acid adenylation domain-containing protein/non-ribosomal peptide synthase protein (TIGR01720 family)
MQILENLNTTPHVAKEPSTIVELLRKRSFEQRDRLAYTFLTDGEVEETTLTYGELDRRARSLAAWLRTVAAPAERVLLLYPSDLQYVTAFFACLYAGVVAVPAYPPRMNRSLDRLQSIVSDSQATVALTTDLISARIQPLYAHAPELKSLRWLATDELPYGLEDEWIDPDVGEHTLAFLQYTSGSTSAPKGVMVTHGNLVHNQRMIRAAFRQTEDSVIAGWLPLYHDMGLIGNVLQPLYAGARCVLMSPVAFLQKPLRWLQAISRFRATTSGGPNFAYELCARKISEEQRASLDLSSWRVAFNGAEPVRAETLDRFSEAFGPCGFRRTAFFPCYGLAEATLFVTGKPAPGVPLVRELDAGSLGDNRAFEATATSRQTTTLVSSGSEFLDQRIEIVNPETLALCASYEVGEIWVAGPSVARGYWARSVESEHVFSAHLSDTGEGPFLRTGDLGFLQDGELFVTGRLKDLIIIRGLNHYPQDIERTVELSSPAVRAGGGAAFSIEVNGEERLAIVQEVERNHGESLDAVFDAIRRAVSETHELQVCAIALVKPGSIPKTSSGKIRRSACRENYLNNRLDLVALWQETFAAGEADWEISTQPANPSESPEALESWLCHQVASILRIDPAQLDSDRPLTHYGLDSLAAVGLAHTIETNVGASVSLTSLLESSSIRQLAEQLYAARGEAAPTTAVIASAPIVDHGQALSHNQQSLWFLHELVPDSAAYNLSFSARVKSDLDTQSLRRALETLVARHASLRTTFAAAADGPIQQIHELMGAAYEELDAATWSQDFLQERLVESAHQPFDLHNGSLLRVKLYRRLAGEHVLLLVAHHIVVDFWSLALLVYELGELYTAETRGRSALLPLAPRQYTDFVRWQHELTASERGESHWDFWQRQLTPPLPALNLPTDRPRPPVQTYRGATQTLRLDNDLSRRLEKLAQAEGTTLFTVLFAAFNVLLYRYTGQADIVVGTPTAGRSRPQFAGVVGYFVNPIALRTQLQATQTFKTLLRQVRQNVLTAFEYSDYPLAQVVKRLQPERDASRSSLFQAMFVMQNSPLPDQQALSAFALNEAGAQIRLGDVLLESISLEQRAAQFDLTLMMAEMSGELLASFEYNTDLFDAATIQRMTENFSTLLAGIANEVVQPLSSLPLLAAEEWRQLREWNDTEADYPAGLCMHQLFEAQVRRTPNAEAVVFQNERLTYAELNARANRIAHFLRRAGVGPESRVGVLMERSAEMLTGMLGILKAGGAYVPLDPAYPQERLSFMLEDAQAKVLLTQERLCDRLPEWQAEIICVDTERELIAAESGDNPEPINAPGNLAYLIYTSGSTGRPKGVGLEHGNAVTLLYWAKDVFAPAEYAGVLASTSICFDLSVFEFFVPLSWGGKVIIAENALQLPQLPAAQEVTLINTVPSAMAELARDGGFPASVRVVNLAGEPLKRNLVDAVYQLGVEKVFNLYGPSEDTTYSTFVLVPEGDGSVTIGRPVANTRVYLLSEDMQPVPAGVPAELYIGSEGLARGYHRRPDLTAERFVPNPFSAEPGARLYRTGDLARYLPNGELDYLGRVDHQVKVRGFRIELGEIEAVLLKHEAVRAAVVVAHEESSGERRLVAYIVPSGKSAPTVTELRRHVKHKLPESMMPAIFVMLDEMPLTPNGKVDRKALPDPSGDRPELEQAFMLPRDEVEEALAEIWAEALNVERVGAYDNFFELGGDSILGVQIIARANRRGLRLSARDLFQHQTVAELADVVKQSKPVEADQNVAGEVPLTPIQHWFFDGPSQVDPHHYNQSVLLEARGELNEQILETVIRQLTEHHDALRLRFDLSEGEWRQFNAAREEASIFTSVDLSGVDRQKQQAFIETVAEETQASLNLSQGPLLKAVFFRPAAGQPARLLLVIHHLGVDGVSWRILLEDLQTGYEQLSLGASRVNWPPKSTSYLRWAERLREYAQKEELQDELAYWESATRRQAATLPEDFSDGVNTVASARDIEVNLSTEETCALLQETTGAYRAAINEVLLAALVGALGKRGVLVDVEGYGREEIADDIDLTRTVGWFTTIYPVLLDAGQARTTAERLKLVKEQLRAVPHHGLNYGVLRYLGDVETTERLRKLPSAQILFNYLGQFDQTFAGRSLFGLAPESSGIMQSPRRLRSHLLEINGRVVEGQLRVVWTYSAGLHEADRIKSLAEKFITELRHLIAHRTAPGVEVLTPSDFPLASLTPASLAKLVEANPDLEDIYRLSPTQEGLLFHSLLSPELGEYVEQLTCVVEGRLEISGFKHAWQTAAEGNAMLRTAFFWESLERPQQVVSREVEVPFVEADWRGLTAGEQQRQFEEHLDEDRRQGFDFRRAPLMRVALFRTGEETHRLVWSYHHILLDGWSMPLVFGEVLAAYEAARDGNEAEPVPSRPFRDYIAWLQQQDQSSAEAYWREYLRGRGGSALLADKRQEEGREFAEQLLKLDGETTAALRDFARRNRVTLNTLVQGVWALLLSRYSGEEDVVFGATVAGRPANLHAIERMVGLFINTLPLRVQVEPGISVALLLSRLQEQQAEVRQFEHNALAEVQVWGEAQPGSPLFDSILVFENYPMDEVLLTKAQSCGLQFHDVRLIERSNYPLTVGVMPGTELLVTFNYQRGRFTDATIGRMRNHFEALLCGIMSDAEQEAVRASMLTAAEEQKILAGWNDKLKDYPTGRFVHELFEAQAERTSEAIALVVGAESLTYDDLNRRANRLAHRLRELGVGTKSRVAVCLERSVESVVGLLGILKAGGAYLPLDPEYPADRLAFVVHDARPLVVLTTTDLRERLSPSLAQLLCLDEESELLSQQSEENLTPIARSEDLAYIIYTSGSTGQPKGVLVEHRNFVHTMQSSRDLYNFVVTDVVPCIAPFAFDISLFELMSPLLAGGCCLLVSAREMLDEAVTLRVLEQSTILHSAPGLMWQMIHVAKRNGAPEKFLHIREAFVGGDAVSPELLREMQQTFAGARVSVGYGPTEATIMCAHYPVAPGQEVMHHMIGAPMNNVLLRLYDRHGNLVPVDVAGELYVGGRGVSRGYLNRDALTAEKYVTLEGERFYRTGDVGSYLPDGNIIFLGRSDHQVKIRGFRVEPGEIENVLSRHEAVRKSTVVAREDASGQKALVAYIVAEEGWEMTAAGLREHLREKLPEHMIPAAFVVLEALPLTPLGKFDRKALPAPNFKRDSAGRGYLAPRNEVEAVLAGIWAIVLKAARVGVEDDFFELGGHSLLATQVISRVREAFGVETPLRALFERPTPALLAEQIEAELRAGAGLVAPPLTPAGRDGALPLSFAQQRLWFLDQLEPGSAIFNMPHVVRFDGPFDAAAIEAAFTEIVRRHEALRTTFEVENGQPVQVINPPRPVGLALHDLRSMPEAEREAELTRFAAEEVKCPFDLSAGPLLRTSLLRLGDEVHVLLFTLHHIVCDGWSVKVLIEEIAALYEAFAGGRSSPLPELAVQYADFAVWQRTWLSGEVLERQLAYWREQVAGAPSLLDLPSDRPRAAVQTHRGASHSFPIPASLIERLEVLSRREGATLFMTTLAAWQTLLYRYTGQTDISVGTSSANRNHAEIEPLIGFFANMLVMRSRFSGEMSFVRLLDQVREMMLGVFAHQDAPFEKLVEELQARRSLSHSPLFQVLFVFENVPLRVPELPGLRLSLIEQKSEFSQYDLTLALVELDGGIFGSLEYNADLFDRDTVERISRHYLTLLESVLADPDEKLSALALLGQGERRQLLTEWSGAASMYDRDKVVHQLFEEQASRTPYRVALVFGDSQMTYAELNARANRLAHHLRGLGVGPEVTVGLCCERSAEMIVGLLGILKAGGAYVPFDMQYPFERLSFLMEDAALSVLLTQEHLLDALPAIWAQVVCLDADWDEIAASPDTNPPNLTDAENLAYMMYTSGSTGEPKGVSVVHRNVVRLVMETSYADFDEGQVFLQLAPISFDASTFEIWGSLLHGSKLVMMPPQAPTLEELGEALRLHEVTTLWLTTGLFHQMVDERAEDLSGVRQLLAGGDVLSGPHVLKALAALGGGRVINGYGPTESTTFACCHTMRDAADLRATPPIGRPIANTEVFILDGRMEPVPAGVAGDLYLGGNGLARAYHRRPGLTAERFVPHPHASAPGARLYKTGDVARYLSDGLIEFMGRSDTQVKVRGFRIEPGEIEAALGAHPSVREAVAVVRKDATGGKRLVGYVVVEEGAETTARELRSHLQQKLPEYMIPSLFVTLGELPLTSNGKVDHKALPEPGEERLGPSALFVPACTPVEEMLAGVWGELLSVTQVGVEDDFFELGGHSLLATQVISRVRETFRVELPLRSIFERPTIAGLAKTIEETIKIEDGGQLTPVEREGGAPLSFAQQRLWFLDQFEAGGTTYNVQSVIRLEGALNLAALAEAFAEVVRRHEVLRTTITTDGDGLPWQIVGEPQPFALDFVDLSALPEEEHHEALLRHAAEEALHRFDLSVGPLLRVSALQLRDEEHVVVLTMHHIISDGWSLGVLIREIAALYQSSLDKASSLLPELPLQYADFAVWQRRWMAGESLNKQLAYWKQALNGAPTVLEMPTDRPRPAEQSFRGATINTHLPQDLTQVLRELSNHEGVTLFMTLFAVFQTLLHRYTGQDDISVGVPIANRNRAETEGLIGFFVNTLVLRTDLSGNPTFTELLRRVREVSLGAYAHQEVPFEALVDELQPERSLSYAPLFQVMFALQNAPVGSLDLPGLVVRPLDLGNHTARFDLSLAVEETAEGLKCSWNYNTDLFDETTLLRIIAHFEVLLRVAAADPELHLSGAPLLAPGEEEQILEEWNDTAVDYSAPVLIHQLFEAQARNTPDRVALVFRNIRWSYDELNRRADLLANYLRGLGVGPETPVGVMMERSLEMVVALFGILKAGGAYVPLDPDYPQERLAFMLEDARIKVLLVQEHLRERLAEQSAKCVMASLDADWDEISAFGLRPELVMLPRVSGANACYVIYTSGSTGHPKGAVNTHVAVCNRLLWMQDAYRLTEDDCVLQKTPFSFDVSVWEFFWPLMTGARLVIAEPGGHRDPEYLVRVIKEQRVTVLHFVPSMLKAFIEHDGVEQCETLKKVMCSGEALSLELQQRFFERQQAELHNLYGPTEAAVDVTFWECRRDGEQHLVPIGKPVANTQMFILDGYMELVPVGVTGELYIGGVQLARGYLGQAALTAERFVPHPFSKALGARLYKTGDLARYRAGGEIEYLGRSDQQVKVRGFRIEPAEIEAALLSYPALANALVVASPGSGGDLRLVAYLVVASGEAEAPSSEDLRRHLLGRLPDYMVPSFFVTLEALPLLPSGKVDRRALPAVGSGAVGAGREWVEPRNGVERALAEVWADVLGVERIGVNDNFFELGGDSILSIQVVARSAQQGLRVTAKQVFQHQTVAGLAAAAEVGDGKSGVRAEQGEVTGAAVLTPVQRWFFEREVAEPWHYNQAVLVEVREGVQWEALREAVAAALKQHDALRLRFRQVEGEWLQESAVGSQACQVFELCDVSELGGSEAEQRAVAEAAERAQRGLRLAEGPVVRAVGFKRGGGRSGLLLVVAHHLVIDGVSWRVLLEDVERGYEQAAAGALVKLGAKTTSYKQWAQGLARYAERAEVAAEAAFWLKETSRQVLHLPLDVSESASGAALNTVGSARQIGSELSVEETRALLTEAPRKYRMQINEVMLAALAQTLTDRSGERRVMVDVESHGREEELLGSVDLSRTIGWFTTIYPIVLESSPADDDGATLARVKQQLRRVPARGFHYGLLRYMNSDRAMSETVARAGSAEILFNYLGQVDQILAESKLFSLTRESSGPSQSEKARRSHLLEINAVVVEGRLQLTWTYSEALHRHETIESLTAEYMQTLRRLVAHCRRVDEVALTPSDFPLAALTQEKLDELLGESNVVEDVYALSSTQRGILFHHLYAPGAELYINQLSCSLAGHINIEAFERSWQIVFDRHPILRTSFAWEGLDEPVQVVRQRVSVPLIQLDWRGIALAEQQERLRTLVQEERRHVFNISQAPFMRLMLIRQKDKLYRLVWTWHHILLDGWSVALVMQEVLSLYEALDSGREANLLRAPLYRDYIAWLRDQDMAAAETYWRGKLEGRATTALTDKVAAPNGHGAKYASHHSKLPTEATRRLQKLARQNQLTLSTLVQGAWAIVMSHHTRAEDVVFGVTTAGRPAGLPGVEKMVGLFINTLPLRLTVEPERELLDWLGRVQDELTELRQYEHSPLVQVQEWSGTGRGVPLFDTIVAFENYPFEATVGEQIAGFRITDAETVDWNNFPLSLVVTPGNELNIGFNYHLQHFDAGTVAHLCQQFELVLRGIAEGPPERLKYLLESLAQADREHERALVSKYKNNVRQGLKKIRRKVMAANT